MFSSFLLEEAFLFLWAKQYFSLLLVHWHYKVWEFSSTLLTLCKESGNTEIPRFNNTALPKEDWYLCCNPNLLLSAFQKPAVLPRQCPSACPAVSISGQIPVVHRFTSTFPIPFETWFPHTDWPARAGELPWWDPKNNLDTTLGRSGLFILIIMITTLEFVFLILVLSRVHWTINNGYYTELTCYSDADKTAAKTGNLSQAISAGSHVDSAETGYHRSQAADIPPSSKRWNKTVVLRKNMERYCVVLNHKLLLEWFMKYFQ